MSQGAPLLRAAFEPAGSPRWIMYVLKKLALDRKHGFLLEVNLVKDQIRHTLQSIEVALKAGEADLIDIDWISIARHRAQGAAITAVFPYGRIVGGLVVPRDSPIRGLPDLRGKKIGVVRLLDKNWIILRAAALKLHGFDPQTEAQPLEALSKTHLTHLLETGEIDGALQFWQLIPPLVVTGRYRQVVNVLDLIQELGLQGRIPITLFTVRDEFATHHPELIKGYIQAFCEAVNVMKEDDGIWEELGEAVLGGIDPRVLHALRESWRDRVMTSWDEETIQGLHHLFDELLKVGGGKLLGVEGIPPGTFTKISPST